MSGPASLSVHPVGRRQESRFAAFRARVRDRLARSSRVFLIGLIVACGIEVLVDWNSTLFEVNVLRDRMRERGYSYVAILAKSATEPMHTKDVDALTRLSAGLFDDEDVIFVRFLGPDGKLIYEQVNESFDQRFAAARGSPLRVYYQKQLDRDVDGMLKDPETLRINMAKSRYRDVAQRWNDFIDSVARRFVKPKAPRAGGLVLYQDRLRTTQKEHDDVVTYAVGAALDAQKQTTGVIMVGFSMERTNASIRTKYLKGAGMIIFFVALILVQNVASRRDKLRLLDLEARYSAAKAALREVLPTPIEVGALAVAGALEQAEATVDGMIFAVHPREGGVELLVVDPDGDGIDAASVGLHVQKAYRRRRDGRVKASIADEIAALGQAALEIPLTRPIGVLLARIEEDGRFEAWKSPLGGVRVLGDSSVDEPKTDESGDAPAGVVGPLRHVTGAIPSGGLLVAICAGLFTSAAGKDARRGLDVDAVAAFVRRGRHAQSSLEAVVHDTATWARGKSQALQKNDMLILAVSRSA